MNLINNSPVCENCAYSKLLFCKKYNKQCLSFIFDKKRYQIPCEECLENNSYIYNEKSNNKNNIEFKRKAILHIPGIEIINNIILLLDKKAEFPNTFFENRTIGEIYGAFPGTIWNGRTPLFNEPFLSIQQINDIKKILENYNINLNLTWNNHLIKDKQLYDTYCNNITELFHNNKHSITVASVELYDYLKQQYPNYSFYKSYISSNLKYEDILNDIEQYDKIIINNKYNNNWEVLNTIENKSKIIFLCNDNCYPKCNKKNHYDNANYCFMNCCYESTVNAIPCSIDQDFKFYNTKRWPHTINPKDIEKYLQNGFTHFKICSRGDSPEILLYKICKYLVKPEFFEDIYFSIL